jgi:hypothetical protein
LPGSGAGALLTGRYDTALNAPLADKAGIEGIVADAGHDAGASHHRRAVGRRVRLAVFVNEAGAAWPS